MVSIPAGNRAGYIFSPHIHPLHLKLLDFCLASREKRRGAGLLSWLLWEEELEAWSSICRTYLYVTFHVV